MNTGCNFFRISDGKCYFCHPIKNSGVAGVLRVKNDGAVAQSVEQRTENPCVGGSIPPHTTRAETQ